LTQQEVLAHCDRHLAGFKTPKAIVFAPALPKNPSGKLPKRDLRERYKAVFEGA
jgi:fatty-acyl-CoA synthase